MALTLINNPFYQGMTVTVELNGVQYVRKVYNDKLAGLYITIKGVKYFEYEVDYSYWYKKREEKKNDI